MHPQLIHGDALTKLQELESESVDCCITSPPYWALRDYKVDGQLGLEPTFQEYINKLVSVFDQVKRTLKRSGSCWVVIGDTYNSAKVGNTNRGCKRIRELRMQNIFVDKPHQANTDSFKKPRIENLSEKSLCLIPERFSIAMIDHGWILRNKIIWYKPNCMPSSAKDRFTVDWEHVYFFTKSQKYFFETQYESQITTKEKNENNWKYVAKYYNENKSNIVKMPWCGFVPDTKRGYNPLGRIKRCVWKISPKPFFGAHFAVFPPDLVKPMLLAGCPQPGLVLDCFMGSGTVGLVAMQNARDFIGIELNPDYIEIAKQRLAPFIGQERLIPAR